MRVKPKLAPTPERAAKRDLLICDAVGQITHEVGIVESLAAAASAIGGSLGDDHSCRRRLTDLVVQIESAARQALDTVQTLDKEVNPGAQP